jgi:hypothetical protein
LEIKNQEKVEELEDTIASLRERLGFTQDLLSRPFPTYKVVAANSNLRQFGFYSKSLHDMAREIYHNCNNRKLIRDIGAKLDFLGGIDYMRLVYYALRPTHNFWCTLNNTWDGIGDWVA